MLLPERERLTLRNSKLFKKTNKPWNLHHFNYCTCIGNLMYLINKCAPSTKAEWEAYYFNSGATRLASMPTSKSLLKQHNTAHGRTQNELIEISNQFMEKLKQYDFEPLSLELIYNFAYIRIIDETWIGYQKEQDALKVLSEICTTIPGLHIAKADYEKDRFFAVDFELFAEDDLLLGIQLKPLRYKENRSKYGNTIKHVNLTKNASYTEQYHVPVLYLYYEADIIVNLENFYTAINKSKPL